MASNSGHLCLIFIWSLTSFGFEPTQASHAHSTNEVGVTPGIHQSYKLSPGDKVHIDTVSTASVTTSNSPVSPPLVQVIPVSVQVPPQVVHVHEGWSDTTSSSESILGTISEGTVSKPPGIFERPIGVLPEAEVHFGFDSPRPLTGPLAVPNCGCVSRGSCLGDVGLYTQKVIAFTDVVCGRTFERCCFDGAWAGVYDSFGAAAACVSKDQCARPYGVLPTDIRDFGVIAPCPGQGAVRCLVVSDEELLVFQGAVAAIDAANAHNAHYHHAIHVSEPMHVTIPFITSSGTLGNTGTTTAQASVATTITGTNPNPPITTDPLPQSISATITQITPPVNPRPIIPSGQASIGTTIGGTYPHPPITADPLPQSVSTTITQITPLAPISPPVNPRPITPSGQASVATTIAQTYPHPPTTPDPLPQPVSTTITQLTPLISISPPVNPRPVIPSGHVGGGGYYGSPGYPWGPAFGFGKGFSFRKRISFNKGGFIVG